MSKKIYGKPGFCIVPDFERPDKSIVAKLGEFPVSIISDGLGRRGIMDAGIKPLNPKLKLCGPALTVEVRAADNLMIRSEEHTSELQSH